MHFHCITVSGTACTDRTESEWQPSLEVCRARAHKKAGSGMVSLSVFFVSFPLTLVAKGDGVVVLQVWVAVRAPVKRIKRQHLLAVALASALVLAVFTHVSIFLLLVRNPYIGTYIPTSHARCVLA